MQQTTIPLFAAYPINGLYSSSFPLLSSRTVMEYNLNNLNYLIHTNATRSGVEPD